MSNEPWLSYWSTGKGPSYWTIGPNNRRVHHKCASYDELERLKKSGTLPDTVIEHETIGPHTITLVFNHFAGAYLLYRDSVFETGMTAYAEAKKSFLRSCKYATKAVKIYGQYPAYYVFPERNNLKFRTIKTKADENHDTLYEWLALNTPRHKWHDVDGIGLILCFIKPEHMMHFKLRWL